MYIGPLHENQNLPENANYNAQEEKLFSTDNPLINSGVLCERGKL